MAEKNRLCVFSCVFIFLDNVLKIVEWVNLDHGDPDDNNVEFPLDTKDLNFLSLIILLIKIILNVFYVKRDSLVNIPVFNVFPFNYQVKIILSL